MQIERGKSVQMDIGLDPTHPLILAYPGGLFEARAYQEPGKPPGQPRFGATFCFPAGHPEAADVYNTILAIAETNFSGVVTRDQAGNITSMITNRKMFAWPFLFGGEYADESQERRREAFRPYPLIVRASTNSARPPGLGLELPEGGLLDIPMDATRATYKDRFWGGCHVWVRIGFTPQLKGNAGVTAYLNAVCSYQTGERIQGFEGGGQQSVSQIANRVRGTTMATGTPYAQPQVAPQPAVGPLPGANAFGAPRSFGMAPRAFRGLDDDIPF